MATQTITNIRIKNRYDNAGNWSLNNPILQQGEIGYDSSNNSIKIGDGSTRWDSLNHITASSAIKATQDASGNVITSTYAKAASLAAVATSGSYNDLTNKPTIPTDYSLPTATASVLGGIKIGSDLTIANGIVNVNHATNADSATKATQDSNGNVIIDTYATKTDITDLAKALKYKGSVNTYSELPTTATVGDVWNVQTADSTHSIKAGENVVWNGSAWDNLGGTCDMSEYIKSADISTVGKTGSYNDLVDKPSIPSTYTLPTASASVLGGVRIGTDLSISANGVVSVSHATNADSATTATQDTNGNVITSTYAKSASLAAVATSGSYNDLTNKPTIPAEYTLPAATTSTLGGIKVGSGLSISSGTLSVSSAPTATKATQDGNGNTITTTYATKTEVNAKASTASPTFTGTVTASTLTVTSALNIPGGKIWIE